MGSICQYSILFKKKNLRSSTRQFFDFCKNLHYFNINSEKFDKRIVTYINFQSYTLRLKWCYTCVHNSKYNFNILILQYLYFSHEQ
jgi:hypothetical protein